MSRLNDLLRRLKNSDPALAADLKREVDALADRRAFGLNFERHAPEAVELPGRKVLRNSKVRILPQRGAARTAEHDRLWQVLSVNRVGETATAELEKLDGEDTAVASLDDLVVVAEFRDPIFPGLVSTGKVERGGDKPFHTVINAENFHALQTLLFTHRGRVDCIYIDPPYNTGAKDWKYNNDYVEGDDLYRHSKWLAFMERRLLLAKELLNPASSVLIVTIDEKEYLRLGLLLEQVFSDARIQMVSSVINPSGSSRKDMFSRSDEYIYFIFMGTASVEPTNTDMLSGSAPTTEVRWDSLQRRGEGGRREGHPELFYPIYFDSAGSLHHCGDPLPYGIVVAPEEPGLESVLPVKDDGTAMRWGISGPELMRRLEMKAVRYYKSKGKWVIRFLQAGTMRQIASGEVVEDGMDTQGFTRWIHAT